MTPLYSRINALAAAAPSRAALIDCDEQGRTVREISYRELVERIDTEAAALAGRSEPLVLEGESSSEFLITAWAAWCAGITLVPLDGKRDSEEMRAYKRDAASRAEGEALILFTSGTTARPKGARLTLDNLMTNAEGLIVWLRIAPEDRFLVQLPLHHINSTTFCLATLLAGGTVLLPPRYSASGFWAMAAETGATLTSIVQTILFDQLSREKEYAQAKPQLKLSRIQIGSAPVVPAAALQFIKRFDIPLYQGYGQTETALRVTGVPMDLPQDTYERMVAQNSIGAPMAWAQVEIASQGGAILSEGEEGELVIKGPAVMQGYVMGEPAFRDDWLLTGDVGLWKTIGGQRFFFLKGRTKEIIIKGGVNISPGHVENALMADVPFIGQAYAVAIPDGRYGEEVGALVVPKADAGPGWLRRLKLSLLQGISALSAYETPRYVKATTLGELPMTSTGKVQRSMIQKSGFEAVEHLFATSAYRFEVLAPHSPLFAESLALYNHCWQPLSKSREEYKEFVSKNQTLMAVAADGTLAGQITYSLGDSLTCLSICSASYAPKPVPDTTRIPDEQEVEAYVRSGKDPVINFHTRQGAVLERVIPNGRPEDMSALGYTVLLAYPTSAFEDISQSKPVSEQLIEAARIIGCDLGLPVYALSRPGGLAAHMARML